MNILWSADHSWTYSPPKNLWGKYEEKLYFEYLLKNSAEKTEDMIYIICLEYFFKNPGGENLRYDTEYCLVENLVWENLDRKTHLGKECNI